MSLESIKNIVLVLSGKGGVGKSSITTQLALSLSLAGHSVGVLDIDLTGPSMPRMFGIETSKVTQAPGGWVPVPVHPADPEAGIGPLYCMSLGFLLRERGDAVVWRGPKKTAMVRQFLSDVLWGNLDYLLIDTPPGTSDEHISLAETLMKDAAPGQVKGAVVVTTPQAVATADVKKELNFCIKVAIDVIGVVENMSGFVCPSCSECTNVFSSGGGKIMAEEFNVKFLGTVPIDPQFVMLVESGITPSYPAGTLINGQAMDGPAEPTPNGQTTEGVASLTLNGQAMEGAAVPTPSSQAIDGVAEPSPNEQTTEEVVAPASNGQTMDGASSPTPNGQATEQTAAPTSNGNTKDSASLVTKYPHCSLYPLFKDITAQVVEACNTPL